MPMTSYMTLEGNDQGAINGDCKQAGREDSVLVYAVDHNVEIPTDVLTGLPTGQRQHGRYVITKHFDPASPKMYQACTRGEQFAFVEIKFFHITDTGQEEHYFTVRMENAIIVNMRAYKPMTILLEHKPYHDMEEVSFTYEKIIWTFEDGGIQSEDAWTAPNA